MPIKLSLCAQEVRRHDWDRFLLTLFAPAEVREDIFTFLAFNSEVARTRDMVTEPLMGKIRLQWWQDVINSIYDGSFDGQQHHYILEHLPKVILGHGLTKTHIQKLIVTRHADLLDQPPRNEQALLDYAFGTSAVLNILLLEIIGERKTLLDSASELGIAWALTGLIRALPHLAKQGRSPLPTDSIAPEQNLQEFNSEIGQAVQSICVLAKEHLERLRIRDVPVERSHRPVFLSSILTAHYLNQISKSGYNPYSLGAKRGYVGRQIKVGMGALFRTY